MGVIRLQTELSKASCEYKGESAVSTLNGNLRKSLPEQNTIMPWDYMTKTNIRGHFQPHLERISDYLVCGAGIWWRQVPAGIEFLDGPNEVDTRTYPPLHQFRSSSLKQEQKSLMEKWNECIQKFCKS
ncbi:hypothetical protein Bbelb_082630 [Branchiostoma belcheri]|nr:hypothetical protein Bbelb_082630 [Branchiostoma belcheri]